MKIYTTTEIQDIADEALNAACRVVQERLGVTNGDLAAHYFQGHTERVIDDVLKGYIREQINCLDQKPTIFKNPDATSAALYLLEADGFNIENPTTSECGRFKVSPQHYGFSRECMGGGFWAHHLDVMFEGEPHSLRVTDVTGERCATHKDAKALIGLYNDDGEQLTYWEV